ncbi:MAG: M1 family metallopeptidase [Flavobacteriales bacterium]|nr:M1 family metallopeptidase [Flavobacteriales bacterium]MCB9446982.1 M1 family metallopeptidase [Flavobacteriales bacterium]
MLRFISLLFAGLIPALLTTHEANAQTYDPLHPPDTYATRSNPNYWKNRKPFQDYWQQDVHYTIKAKIDEQQDVIEGSEQLVYTNNSPDELTFVYFHLYQNAFQPGSYYDQLIRANGETPEFNGYEKNGLGTKLMMMKSNGQDLRVEYDNTVVKVYLTKPLKPGASVTFDIAFRTYYGLYDGRGGALSSAMRRRMKMWITDGNKHYDGVHWYPRISVYDRKFGWTTDQHLGREFYGDFGTYDVELDFASNMVVEATGNLLNRKEVLPDDLAEKLKIENFKDKPWGEAASVITPYDSTQRKTWKYHAENVHDFAFTADPTYRIGEAEWNGIRCVAVAQEPHASRWQNAAAYAAEIIRVYSQNIGMYTYHKMVVADARDGMEYPMLTLDNGGDPGYRTLLCHEIGHNWFFGQVGNNETYRAMLDEGFTTWLTVFSLLQLEGDTIPAGKSKYEYVNKYRKPDLVTWRRGLYPYIISTTQEDLSTLNTHSDDFSAFPESGQGYRNVYYKTGSMLMNLEYVLGKDLFRSAMAHYFEQWKICHPYVEDFRESIIRFTHVDLNWFFDEWIETSKTIDYAVRGIRKGNKPDEYIIRFRRKGEMEMPVDFRVIALDGKQYDYHIPNTWFIKQTEATVLPKWYGRGNLNPVYEARVTIPGGIDDVIIDPSGILADKYKLDNSKRFPVELNYDARIRNLPEWGRYELYGRPDFWYNGFDGVKAGFHLNGQYLNHYHKLHVSAWINTGLFQSQFPREADINSFDDLSWNVIYSTPLGKSFKDSEIELTARHLDGLHLLKTRLSKKLNRNRTTLFAEAKSMSRMDSTDLHYLLYPNEWSMSPTHKDVYFNNTLQIGIEHTYKYKHGDGDVELLLRSSTFGSDYDYSYLRLSSVNNNHIAKFNLRTRTFFQWGMGANWASESSLFLAGANPEEMMENKFMRSLPYYDDRIMGFTDDLGHIQYGGGLNLRGYAGYLVAQGNNSADVKAVYKGQTGVAFNGELEFDKYIRFKPKFLKEYLSLTPYLFGDAGWINASAAGATLQMADVRADGGLGFALTVKKWTPLEMVEPLTFRFDMPFFLNRTPAVSPEYVQMRYVVGVNRAF